MNTKNTTSNSKLAKIKASAYDLVKEEVEKLSGIKKFLFETLFSRIFDIFNDDCTEEDIASSVNSLEKVNSEYVRPDDFLNYDQAMKLLHFSNNRAGFSALMKKHDIQQHTFKNQKIGFKKSEVLALKTKLEDNLNANKKAANTSPKPQKRTYNKRQNNNKGYIPRINKID